MIHVQDYHHIVMGKLSIKYVINRLKKWDETGKNINFSGFIIGSDGEIIFSKV